MMNHTGVPAEREDQMSATIVQQKLQGAILQLPILQYVYISWLASRVEKECNEARSARAHVTFIWS